MKLMPKKVPVVATAACAAVLCASAVRGANIVWQPQGGSTDISLPGNWDVGLPGNGDSKWFKNNVAGDYTVTIPAATAGNPYRDCAGLLVDSLDNGQKVTFDATGTSWVEMAAPGVTWYGGVALRVKAGDHIFNIEGLNAANANDNFGFSLTDGKISFKRDDTNGSRFVFESGTFNNAFSPDGTATPHKNVFFHSTTAPVGSVVELAGGSVTFDQMEIRGKSKGCEVLVSGGEHQVYDGIVINTDKGTSFGADGTLHISGGSLTLESSCLWLGKAAGDKGVLRVDGTGRFEMAEGSQYIYCPDVDGTSALLSIGGHGTWNVSKNFMAGHKAGSTTDILVEEDGYFNHTGYIQLPENSANASLVARDRARVRMTNASLAQGAGKKFNMTVEDSATAEIKCGDIANNATAEFALDLKDDAVLKIGDGNGYINFGNNSGGKIDFTMTGGSLESYSGGEANVVGFRGGPASTYTIAGGTITTKNMVVEGVQNDDVALRTSYTNTVRMTGGTVNVRMNGNGDGLDIRGNDRNAMFLVEDGELNIGTQGGGMIRVGHNGNGNGYHSILRQTGGVMNLGATVNLCDSAADGEIELFGGVARVWTIRGWSWCDVRGNSNKATLYGNGGTLVPWNDNLTFLYTMSGVYVGEDGLTVDTKTYNNVLMRVKVENKDDAAGLFVKKGTGTLRVGLVETDSAAKGDFVNRSLAGEQTYTRIDEGTLLLEDATDAAFGKNVTIKGGAALSIEGTPTSLTVDTLTLGDGHGFAVLKLDAGDTVVVEAANGVTANCGAIDVPWKSTDGTYPVFTCKQGVQIGELDKIAVYNADATKDYGWTTEVDGDTGYTICSVIVAPKGTLTKTITYSSGTITTNGTGKVSGIIAGETVAQSGEISLASTASVSVDADQTMTLNGPLVGTGVELTKTGSGKLVVDGSNPDFYGSFIADGGLLEVLNPAAFGTNPVNFPLVLGGGTFLYSGSDPVVFNGALKIAAPEHKRPVVIDNAGDMTFTSTEYVQGLFIKKGVGTLTLDLPAGTFYIGSGANEENIGEQGGWIDFPASGDTTTSSSGLYGVNILEGTMKVVGQGIDKTRLETRNTANVGGGYKGDVAAILDVENARINWGAGSRHGCLCRDMPAGSPAPEIHLNNAYLWSDSPTIGRYSFDSNMTAKLIMTNSTFYGHYNASIGGDMVAVYIDANNSKLYSNGQIGWTVQAKRLDADFYGAESLMGSIDPTKTDNSAGIFNFYDRVTGELKFRDGATLQTTRGVKMNGATLDVVFNGGKFEIIEHNTVTETASTWTAEKGAGFKTTGKGLELSVVDGFSHSFNFPIYGDGKVVKTGEGTFKLVEARAEGEKLLKYTGGTVVSNGTFVVDGSLVADGAASFEVAAGAALDLNGTTLSGATVSGAGTIANGVLSGSTLVCGGDLPTFDGVTGALSVDFGKTKADPLDMKAPVVIGHYTGDAPTGLTFRTKPLNTGVDRAVVSVSFENGDIVASVRLSGMALILR